MKNYIKVKDQKLYLHFEPQTAPSGRLFRHSGIRKDLTKPEKWLDGMYCSCYIYTFIYLDNKEIFEFYFEYQDQFSHKIKKM